MESADFQVPIQTGLRASEREGKPISARYEIEDGWLQLSVYTTKNSGFEEVIVDHSSTSWRHERRPSRFRFSNI
jgi:hypothetical protein